MLDTLADTCHCVGMTYSTEVTEETTLTMGGGTGWGWTLEDSTGAYLYIGEHGHLSPNRYSAELEALHRIERGDGYNAVRITRD